MQSDPVFVFCCSGGQRRGRLGQIFNIYRYPELGKRQDLKNCKCNVHVMKCSEKCHVIDSPSYVLFVKKIYYTIGKGAL